MRRIGWIADAAQRVIGFHAAGEIEGSIMEQRPAAMRALCRAQIDADFRFQFWVDTIQKVLQ